MFADQLFSVPMSPRTLNGRLVPILVHTTHYIVCTCNGAFCLHARVFFPPTYDVFRFATLEWQIVILDFKRSNLSIDHSMIEIYFFHYIEITFCLE